eukprot:gene16864-19246_t
MESGRAFSLSAPYGLPHDHKQYRFQAASPTAGPTAKPTRKPTSKPTVKPTREPTTTFLPTLQPSSQQPTVSQQPSSSPTTRAPAYPTIPPTAHPTAHPTARPTTHGSLLSGGQVAGTVVMGVLVVAGLLIFAYYSKNRKTAQITGSSSDSPLPIPTAPPLRNGEE